MMKDTEQDIGDEEVTRATRAMVLVHAALVVFLLAVILFVVPVFGNIYCDF